MKPTPTQIEAFYKAHDEALELQPRENHQAVFSGLSAALSVPSAAVVGEPVAWIPQSRWERMTAAEPWLTNIVYSEDQSKFFSCVPLYAAPSAPDGWQPIETAPKDGTEILAYGYARCDGSRYANGQHIAWWDAELGWTGRDPDDRVTLHPSHWRPLPAPPALGGASHE